MKRSVFLMRAQDKKRAQEQREREIENSISREYSEGIRGYNRRMPAIRENDE